MASSSSSVKTDSDIYAATGARRGRLRHHRREMRTSVEGVFAAGEIQDRLFRLLGLGRARDRRRDVA